MEGGLLLEVGNDFFGSPDGLHGSLLLIAPLRRGVEGE